MLSYVLLVQSWNKHSLPRMVTHGGGFFSIAVISLSYFNRLSFLYLFLSEKLTSPFMIWMMTAWNTTCPHCSMTMTKTKKINSREEPLVGDLAVLHFVIGQKKYPYGSIISLIHRVF